MSCVCVSLQVIEKLLSKQDLSEAESSQALRALIDGAEPVQMAAFLVLLRAKVRRLGWGRVVCGSSRGLPCVMSTSWMECTSARPCCSGEGGLHMCLPEHRAEGTAWQVLVSLALCRGRLLRRLLGWPRLCTGSLSPSTPTARVREGR